MAGVIGSWYLSVIVSVTQAQANEPAWLLPQHPPSFSSSNGILLRSPASAHIPSVRKNIAKVKTELRACSLFSAVKARADWRRCKWKRSAIYRTVLSDFAWQLRPSTFPPFAIVLRASRPAAAVQPVIRHSAAVEDFMYFNINFLACTRTSSSAACSSYPACCARSCWRTIVNW